MQLKALAVVMVIAGLVAGPATAATRGARLPTTFGDGVLSCATWTLIKAGGELTEERLKAIEWLEGFVSGANAASRTNYIRTPYGINNLIAWMDKYCQEHPSVNIGNAATTMIDEMPMQ
jgi:hypothetical protein